MKCLATAPSLELTLSALLREIFAEHADDPALLPLHLGSGKTRRGQAAGAYTPPGTVPYRPSADAPR
jgi:hypothetical protein